MGKRQLHPDSVDASSGMACIGFSFVANGSANPTITTSLTGTNYRGDGLLPGVAGTVAIVHQSTGTYLVTLDPGYTCRYVTRKFADMEANTGGDGSYATITAMITGEGTATSTTGSGQALSFNLYTHAAGGTLTDFTSRRISVELELKLTGAGS